jgi:UDP-glucuronate decarboxylase
MSNENNYQKNILVIGGAGFMGSHLCDELVGNANVICLDDFSSGDEMNIDHLLAHPNFKFIKHNIVDLIDLEKYSELEKMKIKFHGLQEIYYLACPTAPVTFKEDRMAILLANSYGVKNALDLALKYKSKFMLFSSSVVYGPRREGQAKIKEEDLGQVDQLSARSAYDEGKRFSETLVANYREIHKVDAKIIRFFRVYGPRMQLSAGHMIPDFIVNALDNKDLIINGDENFSSAFCYIKDAIDATVKMMTTDLAGPINIGSDIDINLNTLAQKIITKLESNSKIVNQEKLLFLTSLNLPDITRARNELGWLPIVTLNTGLDFTIDDLRAKKGLRRM